MTTTMSSSSSAWSKPGAWALDSELHEDELSSPLPPPSSTATVTATDDFPSLSAAKQPTKKKPTKKVLSLAQFSTYTPPSHTSSADVVVLPTGPRERTAEEIAESRRGGFRNYGGGDRDRDRPRVSRDDVDSSSRGPSRADEADDWGKGKKLSSSSFGPGSGSGPDRERDMGPSRADEVDDWSKGKKFGSGSGFGSGAERGERRERMGFFNSSRADDVDNWAANKGSGPGPRRVGFEGTGPRAEVDNWVKGKESIGTGRPRLNLQPRTLPVENLVKVNNNNENDENNVEVAAEVEVGVVKGKANPFGAARPREEVLKEKGKDWKEIDDKLEALKLKEVERSGNDRRGFGFGRTDGVDDRSVGAWRRPGLVSNTTPVAAPAADVASDVADAAVSYADVVAVGVDSPSAEPEITESTGKSVEDN